MIIIKSDQINELPINVREFLASDETSSIDTLITLSDDPEKSVILSLLNNKKIPIQLLIKFSDNIDEDIRKIVAENPLTPVDVIERLSNDSSSIVSESAKNNPSYVPIPVLVE